MKDELESGFDLAIRKDDARDVRLGLPRWLGGPPICEQENLPAFESKQTAIDWHEKPKQTNPLYEANHITKLWCCKFCSNWHFLTKPRPPSGSSSGTGRGDK